MNRVTVSSLNKSSMVVLQLSRNFSGTGYVQGQKSIRYLKSQKRRQKNEAIQASIKNSLDTVDPVLGREDTPFITRVLAELKEPNVLSSGYDKSEVEKIFGLIESTNVEKMKISLSNNADLNGSVNDLMSTVDIKNIEKKREAILRILNIKNASNEDSLKLGIRLAREEFQRFPGDTGSSEVQAACMTIRIYNLANHVKENHKDFANIRNLRILVQQRQSILKYLKRDNPERYYWTIQKLGLSDNAVMKEFNMDKQYMQDYKFLGDKILVKESKNKTEQKRKEIRKQRKISGMSISTTESNAVETETSIQQ